MVVAKATRERARSRIPARDVPIVHRPRSVVGPYARVRR